MATATHGLTAGGLAQQRTEPSELQEFVRKEILKFHKQIELQNEIHGNKWKYPKREHIM